MPSPILPSRFTTILQDLLSSLPKEQASAMLLRLRYADRPEQQLRILKYFQELKAVSASSCTQISARVIAKHARIDRVFSKALGGSESMEVDEEPPQEETSATSKEVGCPPEKKRRIECDFAAMEIEENSLFDIERGRFSGLLAIIEDPEISPLYQSVFGIPLLAPPETSQLRKMAIDERNIIALAKINSTILDTYQQLRRLPIEWEALSLEIKARFGPVDSSKILESSDSCKLVLWALTILRHGLLGFTNFVN